MLARKTGGSSTCPDGGDSQSSCTTTCPGELAHQAHATATATAAKPGCPQLGTSRLRPAEAALVESRSSFVAFFVRTRMLMDAAFYVVVCTVIPCLAATRVLQTLCHCPSFPADSQPAASSGLPTNACHPGEEVLIKVPAAWQAWVQSGPYHELQLIPPASAVHAAAAATGQPLPFPCMKPATRQLAWIARHYPLVYVQAFVGHTSFFAPFSLATAFCGLLAIVLWPVWYLRGGRTLLLFLLGPGTKALLALELAVVGTQHVPSTRVLLDALYTDSVRASMMLLVECLLLPLPGALHPLLCTTNWFMVVVVQAILARQTAVSSPMQLLKFAVRTLTLGVALPVPVVWLHQRALQRQQRADQRPLHASGGAARPHKQQQQQLHQPQQSAKLYASTQLNAPYARQAMGGYRVGLKVHHHEAFNHRNAIRDELEAYLRMHLNPCEPPSTPTGEQPPPKVMALSTVMVRGCLQLLVTAHTVPAPGAACSDAGGANGTGGDGSTGVNEAPRVPTSPRVLGQLLQGHVDALRRQYGCPVTVSSHGASTLSEAGVVQEQPLVQVRVAPLCMEAGAGAAGSQQEVLVEVAGLPAWVVWKDAQGEDVLGVEAVVSCWIAGHGVVLRQVLLADGAQPDAAAARGGSTACCRLKLPPQLDAAPMEVHLVTTCPDHEGVLLGSNTTMALPPAAAQQLLAAVPAASGDGSRIVSGVQGLLEDMAVAWKLLQPGQHGRAPGLGVHAPGPAAGAAAVDHMVAYCCAGGLTALADVLQQLLINDAPNTSNNTSSRPGSAARHSPGGFSMWALGVFQASLRKPFAATAGLGCSAVAGEGREERYTWWKLQQGRAADLLAAVGTVVLARALARGVPPAPLPEDRAPAPLLLLDAAMLAGPWLALALGPACLRLQRARVMLLQSVLTAFRFLGMAAGLLPATMLPRPDTARLTMLAAAFVFPALQRVGWRQQLLCSFFLHEIPRLLMLHAAATTACSEEVLVLNTPSTLHVAVVSALAASAAWVVERQTRAVFRRVLACQSLAVKHGCKQCKVI